MHPASLRAGSELDSACVAASREGVLAIREQVTHYQCSSFSKDGLCVVCVCMVCVCDLRVVSPH